MTPAYISIGSNIAQGDAIITQLFDYLVSTDINFNKSSIYSTDSISGDGTRYFNSVIKILTHMSPQDLTMRLKEIETLFGRDKIQNHRVVTLDLDLVIYDDVVLRQRDFSRDYFQIGYRQLQLQQL